jgi:diguanylate cyclase (GGDEF)-like protein
VKRAEDCGIPTYTDYRKLAESPDVDLLIDASGNADVEAWLLSEMKSNAQVLSGYSAWFLWRMVDEHEARQKEMERNLAEQEILYSAGVMLASAADTEQTLNLIMEAALSLTGMAAGTLALYDEEKGMMSIKVNLGFDHAKLPDQFQWKVRPGGLTGMILSNDRPTVIEDLADGDGFDAQNLIDLGVRSLIAAPLKVEGKIVGILYVDDFVPKKFDDREVNTLNLLAVQAAAAIDKALLLEKAEMLAVTDELTKLYNHRYFIRALEREMKRTERYDEQLTLCMVDVDYFKKYNDTWGHLQGNTVLTTLARILQNGSRGTDVVARYGGEEFAIIFVQAEIEDAMRVAERIREEVESYPFHGQDKLPGGNLTISLGMACFPGQATTAHDLIEFADQALYRSKAEGRNRMTLYQNSVDQKASVGAGKQKPA